MTSITALRNADELAPEIQPLVHVFGKDCHILCDTEARGHATPENMSPFDLALHASLGFIPLWEKGTVLRWRFQERALRLFADSSGMTNTIRDLLGEAVLAWGDALPVKFTEDDDLWDFEIVVRNANNCNAVGACVLASAFFPDGGRHELVVYPRLFDQSRKEQVDTFIHEIGHVFGLRHFFANVSETSWPVELFGVHNRFTIMNYGADSELTHHDKEDLKRLYEAAWSGALTDINGTPIRLVKPYHASGVSAEKMMAISQIETSFVQQPTVAPAAGK